MLPRAVKKLLGRNLMLALGLVIVLAMSLAALLAPLGVTAALIEDPARAEELAANTAEAATRGVFGAPTFITRDEMFFGNDRLDFLRQSLKAAA